MGRILFCQGCENNDNGDPGVRRDLGHGAVQCQGEEERCEGVLGVLLLWRKTDQKAVWPSCVERAAFMRSCGAWFALSAARIAGQETLGKAFE